MSVASTPSRTIAPRRSNSSMQPPARVYVRLTCSVGVGTKSLSGGWKRRGGEKVHNAYHCD
eukprot:1722948-Pleurochrysis_carterae.AAC.1